MKTPPSTCKWVSIGNPIMGYTPQLIMINEDRIYDNVRVIDIHTRRDITPYYIPSYSYSQDNNTTIMYIAYSRYHS